MLEKTQLSATLRILPARKVCDWMKRSSRRGVELDPLSFFMNRELGRSLYLARRYDEAIQQLRRSGELYPNSGVVENWLSEIAEKQGNYVLAMQFGITHDLTAVSDTQLINPLRHAYELRDWKLYAGGAALVPDAVGWTASRAILHRQR